MRLGLIIAGVIVAALGIAGITGALHYKQDQEVVRIGDLSAKTEETRGIPQWLGIAAIVVGGVLVAGGAMRRT
jgi:hypothetical protein